MVVTVVAAVVVVVVVVATGDGSVEDNIDDDASYNGHQAALTPSW